jgi:TalC/MipB family fructose-6-phosphate aldolase
MVPELQVEALGDTVETILAEADRIMSLPLKSEPVFKVPISNAGVMACQRLTAKGRRVNVHLIYTLSQAYMAVAAGAAFVCPLAGRLQDQGHDAIKLFEQCVEMIDRHNYDSKVMFSSVRHPEHVRQALLAGVHVCTVPYNVISHLCDNSLTALGTAQFREHTQLMTMRVKELIRAQNPVCTLSEKLSAAMVKMTESRLGVVSIVDGAGRLVGIFTDGDLRRHLQSDGHKVLESTFDKIAFTKTPVTIGGDALLDEAVKLFKEFEVDSIVVLDGDKPSGVLDIQDLVKLGLLGQEHL